MCGYAIVMDGLALDESLLVVLFGRIWVDRDI
jgi:hypothetical protein